MAKKQDEKLVSGYQINYINNECNLTTASGKVINQKMLGMVESVTRPGEFFENGEPKWENKYFYPTLPHAKKVAKWIFQLKSLMEKSAIEFKPLTGKKNRHFHECEHGKNQHRFIVDINPKTKEYVNPKIIFFIDGNWTKPFEINFDICLKYAQMVKDNT